MCYSREACHCHAERHSACTKDSWQRVEIESKGSCSRSRRSSNCIIIGIYQKNNNEYILLTNNSSNIGNVIFYYLSTGLTGSPFSVSIGKIEDCVEISTGVYLVAEGSNLTLINCNTFSTLSYLTGVTANKLKYDSQSNELFVVDGSQITIYDYTTKSVKSIYVHPTAVVDLDFWYNK